MREIYENADKVIEKLKKSINAEFHNAKNEIGFDALNIISVKENTKELYARLKARNDRAFRWVFKKAYQDACEEAEEAGYHKKHDALPDVVGMILSSYHPVTEYKYNNEIRRKRDRLFESIVSALDRMKSDELYNRAARLWFDQSRQYTDIMVDEGRMRAFKDSGVRAVQWVSQKDGRVCATCDALDGEIFDISEVPPKPHRRCRCVIRPVSRFGDIAQRRG